MCMYKLGSPATHPHSQIIISSNSRDALIPLHFPLGADPNYNMSISSFNLHVCFIMAVVERLMIDRCSMDNHHETRVFVVFWVSASDLCEEKMLLVQDSASTLG